MRRIQSKEGREQLRRMLASRCLLVFDLDGVLAPIVRHPSRVTVPERTRTLLQQLQKHRPVILLTGRHAKDAARLLRWKPSLLIGNHGCEGLPGVEADLPHIERACVALKTAVEAVAATSGPKERWWVEDKRYTLTFHSRSAAKRAAVERAMKRKAATLGCRVLPGKNSLNLLPRGAHTKGECVGILLKNLHADGAMFIGDDITDETVFRLRRKDVLGIHVGRGPSAATYAIRSQRGVGAFLAFMEKTLSE